MGAQWKHKGRTEHAAAKGRLFTKLVKELIIAAKAGGPEVGTNPRLRLAVEQAKKARCRATRWSAPSRRARACWTSR
ncbi:hypothetical protein ACN28S_19040 [Cystobacter fuscus]